MSRLMRWLSWLVDRGTALAAPQDRLDPEWRERIIVFVSKEGQVLVTFDGRPTPERRQAVAHLLVDAIEACGARIVAPDRERELV